MIRVFARHALAAAALVSALTWTTATAQPADPLPSWNAGAVKQSILDFVAGVTREGSPDFVPPAERIATFDNDGTLWVEKPLPNELYFVRSAVQELVAKNPALGERQPYRAAVEGDAAYFHEAGARAVVELLVASHSNMTREQFSDSARQFLQTGRHPT